jgi:hypothetical protein
MTNLNPDILRREIEALRRELGEHDEDNELRRDMLEGATDMHEVLRELVATTDDTETLIDALDERMERLASRRSRLKQRVETMRGTILKILQAADLKKLVLPEATLSQRQQQPQLVGVLHVNADELPDHLCRIKREPDRVAIREALMKGDLVPGVFLSNAPPTLTISTR